MSDAGASEKGGVQKNELNYYSAADSDPWLSKADGEECFLTHVSKEGTLAPQGFLSRDDSQGRHYQEALHPNGLPSRRSAMGARGVGTPRHLGGPSVRHEPERNCARPLIPATHKHGEDSGPIRPPPPSVEDKPGRVDRQAVRLGRPQGAVAVSTQASLHPTARTPGGGGRVWWRWLVCCQSPRLCGRGWEGRSFPFLFRRSNICALLWFTAFSTLFYATAFGQIFDAYLFLLAHESNL